MAYLTAAVIVVGLLCLLDLALSLGIIRRLRTHTELLSRVPSDLAAPAGVPVGEVVAEFTATTVDGEPVSRGTLDGRTLVGFFSPGCGPCEEMLPGFIEQARSTVGGRDHVLAVLASDAAGDLADGDYRERLLPVARVVVEEPDGPMQSAFQVAGYPTLYLVDAKGTVAAVGSTVGALAGAPAAPAQWRPRENRAAGGPDGAAARPVIPRGRGGRLGYRAGAAHRLRADDGGAGVGTGRGGLADQAHLSPAGNGNGWRWPERTSAGSGS